jgi:uncharacterized protein YqhQ
VKPEISYGGQAVIEGVMIRSPRFLSVACRLPNEEIDVHTERITSFYQRHPALRKIPLLRGIFALFEMLFLGLRTLERSANLQLSEEEAGQPLSKGAMTLTMVAGLAIGIVLFLVLPRLIVGWIERPFLATKAEATVLSTAQTGGGGEKGKEGKEGRGEETDSTHRGSLGGRIWLNLIEGLIRLGVFILYIIAITTIPPICHEIRRVFAYHGAEHKVVNTHEAGQTVALGNALGQSTIHPRCGTNFAFIVIVMSIVVFSLLPWIKDVPWWQKIAWHVLPRLALLPVVAGVSYEIVKLAGQFYSLAPMRALIAPGLLLQRLTTREPEESMIEVALAAFRSVQRAEETGEIIEDASSDDAVPAAG